MIGWQCPGCGRCFSPFTPACGFCGPVVVSGTSTVTGCTCGQPQTTAACPVHGVRTLARATFEAGRVHNEAANSMQARMDNTYPPLPKWLTETSR